MNIQEIKTQILEACADAQRQGFVIRKGISNEKCICPFRALQTNGGSLSDLARTLFGWSETQTYSFFSGVDGRVYFNANPLDQEICQLGCDIAYELGL